MFQVAKQLQAFAAAPVDMGPTNPLYLLERAMGVTQHHDAVSGTSKQHVANDYALRLAKGRDAAAPLLSSTLGALSGYADAPFVLCDLHNVTICATTEAGGPFALLLYNQRSEPLHAHSVRVPLAISPNGFSVTLAADGTTIPSQSVPLTADDVLIRTTYYNVPMAKPVEWLAFTLPTVPAMGFTVALVQPKAAAVGAGASASAAAAVTVAPILKDTTLSNGLTTLTFSATTGLLTTFNGQPFSQTYLWWNSSTGSSVDDQSNDNDQRSGAYIFRPNGTTPFGVAAMVTASQTASGPVVWEMTQTWSNWAVCKVRLWANQSAVEFEWSIGPVPFSDGNGKEVISRYSAGPSFASAATWVSDSNGRDAITRVRDKRRSWNYTVVEPVSGNYVPVNLFQTLTDGTTTYSIVTDRTQAGSSMEDGSLDFMLHRRILADDNRGVGEPLNETGLNGGGLIVRGRHWVSQDAALASGASLRSLAAASLFKPLWLTAPHTGGATAWGAGGGMGSWSGLRSGAGLPPNLHIVTLHAQAPKTLLLRVAHMFAVGESATLSGPVSVDLATLFSGFNITSAEELILPGTIPLTEAPTTTYTVIGGGTVQLPEIYPAPAGPALTITLEAMQIRTFKVTRS